MFLTDFIRVLLIPAVITSNSTEASPASFALPQSSEENGFHRDAFFERGFLPEKIQDSPRQQVISDPILREIYEEERRLDLVGGDEDFDGMRSEEARELIQFQRRKAAIKESFRRQQEEILAQLERDRASRRQNSRALELEELSRAPRENEVTTGANQQSTTVGTTTPAPPPPTASTSRLGIGGVFGKVKTKVDNVFGKIFGGGVPATTTTTAPSTASPPPPSTNNGITFPDEDKGGRPKPTSLSPGIIFDEIKSTPTPTNQTEPEECLATQTLYNGECFNVLQQLPCQKGQWLVEDDETGKGKCVTNQCDGVQENSLPTAYFGGKCVVARMAGPHCAKGMVPYIYKNGDVECDCQDRHLYNQKDGNCYPAYKRGPCRAGEMFASKVTPNGALPAACVRSKCSQDGYFCTAPTCPKDRNCVQLGSTCEAGVWEIHPERLTPFCTGLQPELGRTPDRIIGNVPTLACAPGSRRDILGTCRKPSKISFS